MAGILEGEACFVAPIQGRRNTPNIQIQVVMSDKDVVTRVARLFGSNVRRPYRSKKFPNAKLMYGTGAHGVKALAWMMTVYQFMGERRQKKIREIIEVSKKCKPLSHAEVSALGRAARWTKYRQAKLAHSRSLFE